MENQAPKPAESLSSMTEHPITVLLVDDQAMIGEAVRRMLSGEKDIRFHYCGDPTQALKAAAQVSPTVILQDLVMPEVDGLTLVKFFRANPATRDIPMIVLSSKEEPKVKAEAFALGANDYLVKLPDRIELIARIRYHSRGYINLLQRNEAFGALVESQKLLAAELAEAAAYVRSLLPPPLEGAVKTDWQFVPSTSLGGDSFGYHWLDPDRFAMYLLDVSGHGVGAALLSISAMNMLRSQTLPDTRFDEPDEVLSALNDTFQMENQNNMYFTIWYGVYDRTKRQIVYASGGHPPALLTTDAADGPARVMQLKTPGMIIGGMPGMTYQSDRCDVGDFKKLYLFSDGVYEIARPDGAMWAFEDYVALVAQPSRPGVSDIDRIVGRVKEVRGSDSFEDDFSIVQVVFD